MSANKTVPTDASVSAYPANISNEARRKDCEALAELMSKATGQPPAMWGTSIVGFGSYHYRYDSGREGDMCVQLLCRARKLQTILRSRLMRK